MRATLTRGRTILIPIFALISISLWVSGIFALYAEASTKAAQRFSTPTRFEQSQVTVYGDTVNVFVDNKTGIACYRNPERKDSNWSCATVASNLLKD